MNYGKQIERLIESGLLFLGEVEELIARGNGRERENALKKLADKVESGDVSLSDVVKLTG